MKAATEGSLPPVMPQGNLVEVLGREVRQGSPGELMVDSTPSRQRWPPCKTNKEESDEAADAAALTYLLLTAPIMSNVQELFWFDTRDEQGCLLHAPDCDQWNCFVVEGKKQETNTSGRAKLPSTITVRSVVTGRSTKTSATTSNASQQSSRARTAVARAAARATPTRTVARASPRTVAKAKRRAKLDEEALIASLTGTRTLTSPEGTPILHQGGTLSPLVGSGIRGLRPVPRRKPNKNKGLSVQTKMGTSRTPANVPASGVWRRNCRRRCSK